MPIAVGTSKTIRFKKQAGLGAIAAGGAATGKLLRRVTGNFDLKKEQYRSAEIRASMQRADSRHGVRSVEGSLNGEYAPGAYQEFLESLLRAPAAAVATTGAQSLGATAGTGITRAAGSFVTDGFVVGSVVRASGFAGGGANNNGKNFLVTGVAALTLSGFFLDGSAIATIAGAAGVTVAEIGKDLMIPSTGHTRDYYTIEQRYGDVGTSEVFTDVCVTSANIRMPATGIPTIEFGFMGLDLDATASGAGAYFTSPAAAGSGGLTTSASGALVIDGVKIGTLTGLEISINGNFTRPGGVVGSNVDPDLFPGMIDVSGNATILFDSVAQRDKFINESVVSLIAVLTTGNSVTADFISIAMTNVKFGDASKDDGEKGLVMTLPFIASEDTSGVVGNAATTLRIQESLFV